MSLLFRLKFPVLFFSFLFFGAVTSFACMPPPFPVPKLIVEIHKKSYERQVLTEREQFLSDDYEADQRYYFTIYNELYPCRMDPDYKASTLTDAQKAQKKEELKRIEVKWQENIHNGYNGGYNIDIEGGETVIFE